MAIDVELSQSSKSCSRGETHFPVLKGVAQDSPILDSVILFFGSLTRRGDAILSYAITRCRKTQLYAIRVYGIFSHVLALSSRLAVEHTLIFPSFEDVRLPEA